MATSSTTSYDALSTLVNRTYTGYLSTSETQDRLKRLRRIILTEGIAEPPVGLPDLRPRIWKLLFGVDKLGSEKYLQYVARGPSSVSAKSMSPCCLSLTPVKDDTFRTFRTDSQFQDRVKEEDLIRLLEAFAWRSESERSRSSLTTDPSEPGRSFTYVQGMNAMAAPFLYVMCTQVEAFACFATLIERWCPQYFLGTNTEGAIRGTEVGRY